MSVCINLSAVQIFWSVLHSLLAVIRPVSTQNLIFIAYVFSITAACEIQLIFEIVFGDFLSDGWIIDYDIWRGQIDTYNMCYIVIHQKILYCIKFSSKFWNWSFYNFVAKLLIYLYSLIFSGCYFLLRLWTVGH